LRRRQFRDDIFQPTDRRMELAYNMNNPHGR
jgi:hypothetical protein